MIASMIGVDRRTTMDMDTAIKSYPVEEEQIVVMLLVILITEVDDGVSFDFVNVILINEVIIRNISIFLIVLLSNQFRAVFFCKF